MEQIFDFLESYSGAFTFLITVVYVIATIFIYSANKKAANASHDQIAESKRQFDENRRLGIMPYLQMKPNDPLCDFHLDLPLDSEEEQVNSFSSVLQIKNLGNGAATNLVYTWKSSKVNITDPFPINAIGTQDSCDVECVFSEASFLESNTYCCRLSLQYEDLLGYSYEQDFIFEFGDVEGTDGLVKCETCAPEYLGKIYYRLNKETNQIERVLEK